MTDYNKSFGATAYLTFNDKQIALTAKDISKPVFIYHAESFYTAITLGNLEDSIAQIGSKAADIVGQGGDSVETEIKSKIDEAKKIPGLGDALAVILDNDLVITDFVINTQAHVYEFGLGLRFIEEETGESRYKLGPVSLDGISILVKAEKKP
jgi:hypothetical protein